MFFLTLFALSQEAIDVTGQTIEVDGLEEEELLFGFAEGDKIIFSLSY